MAKGLCALLVPPEWHDFEVFGNVESMDTGGPQSKSDKSPVLDNRAIIHTRFAVLDITDQSIFTRMSKINKGKTTVQPEVQLIISDTVD